MDSLLGQLDSLERSFRRMTESKQEKQSSEQYVSLLEQCAGDGLAGVPEDRTA